MKLALQIITMLLSVGVIVLILAQGKGAGLGSAWGGGGELFQTRRGIQKVTLYATIAGIVLFFIVSLISLFVK